MLCGVNLFVEATVNSKEDNFLYFCPSYVQEYGLRRRGGEEPIRTTGDKTWHSCYSVTKKLLPLKCDVQIQHNLYFSASCYHLLWLGNSWFNNQRQLLLVYTIHILLLCARCLLKAGMIRAWAWRAWDNTEQQRPFCRPGFACASTQISQRFLSLEKLLIVEEREFLWEITRQHKILFITVHKTYVGGRSVY